MAILKVPRDNPDLELDFELAFQADLSVSDRFKMMRRASRRILRKLIARGDKKAFEIIKRHKR